MILKTFVEPPIDNNNYLVIDKESKEAVLIDCSSSELNEKVRIVLDEFNANLKYILLTHGHFDHIAGIPALFTAFMAKHINLPKIVMNKNDLEILKKSNQYLPMFGIPDITIPNIDIFAEDNDVLDFGHTNIKVIHTPGHTQGGVCYLIDNILFSGDTVFRECVGRCDLEGGNFNQIVESINSKIFTLPDNIEIYPGHGTKTSVGWEKVHNRFA